MNLFRPLPSEDEIAADNSEKLKDKKETEQTRLAAKDSKGEVVDEKEECSASKTKKASKEDGEANDHRMDESEAEKNDGEDGDERMEEEGEDDIYIPQAEYSAVCNGDFLPMICNDFVTDFLDKEHGACSLDRSEAIDLTRNFCHWISNNGLTCARISLYQ